MLVRLLQSRNVDSTHLTTGELIKRISLTDHFILVLLYELDTVFTVKTGAGLPVINPQLTPNFELDNDYTENFKKDEANSTDDCVAILDFSGEQSDSYELEQDYNQEGEGDHPFFYSALTLELRVVNKA